MPIPVVLTPRQLGSPDSLRRPPAQHHFRTVFSRWQRRRRLPANRTVGAANLGFEAKLWLAAEKGYLLEVNADHWKT